MSSNFVFGANYAGTTAQPGFSGTAGGTALGGGIYNAGPMYLERVVVKQNQLLGGSGGNAGFGIIDPQSGVCLSQPVVGGRGGNASGGGVFSTANFGFTGDVSGNTVTAGVPGAALGPAPCSIGLGALGVASNPNIRQP